MQRMMQMSRNVFVGTAAVLALGLPATGSAFDLGAEATIDYRQGVMRAIGGNMASTAAIVVDGADYRDNLEMHARYLVDATRDIPALFPEDSDFGETDALAAVWEEPEKFAERARDTHEAAVALHAAVEVGDDAEMGQRFRALGQSCRSCHDDFRQSD
ncbi:cytochrome c [Thioalkalivibrio nitratireducens]